MKKLLILDSNSIINRAFYGVATLTAQDGTPTNGIYGFLNILIKLINDYKPQYILAAFDLKAPTFRHKMYDKYKANRKGMPDELAVQMPILKEILGEMNIPLLQLEGYEADDIIGTVSRICGENGIECLIATGDRDDLQLAGGGTTVILTSTKQGRTVTELYDAAAVKEKYSVTPSEFVDLKALMGDKSDNIPGVSGIGEKTASKLISEYSTIENMYEHIDELDVTERIKNKLRDERDAAFLSKQLAAIDTRVPIEPDLVAASFDVDKPEYGTGLYQALAALGLKSVIKKLELTPPAEGAEQNDGFFDDKTIIICSDAAEFAAKTKKLSGKAAIYLNMDKDALLSAAVSDGKTAVCADFGGVFEAIKPILENDDIPKITCGIKNALAALFDDDDSVNIIFDCAVAAYLDNPSNSFDIESLAAHYLGVYIDDKEEQEQLSLLDDAPKSDRDGKYALAVYALYELLSERIETNGQQELFYNAELPLIRVLADMQRLGITLDTAQLGRFGKMLGERIKEKETAIYALAGEEFNINSPKQLGTVLFEKMKLPGGKKTKSGYSTRADVLEKLSGRHKIISDILQYRTYQKLKSTYCDSLAALADPETKRIHSVFHQTGTVTGRLSSSDPNLQNIPTRTELGRELRKMFVAKEGCVLVDADYSQIELRVLAHLSDDEAMTDAFANGADIHAVTASKILGIPIDQLTKEERASAKAINFGIVYGMSEYSLSQDLGISFKQAKSYMDEYFGKYSGVRRYLDELKRDAYKNGCVKTMMGRIRYIPELSSSNANLRGYGERIAMNTPIQGTAADIIKLAMVRVYNRLKEERLAARLILQVHDELIIEAPENEAERVTEILKNEMENAAALRVPLIVDISVGKSWYEAK